MTSAARIKRTCPRCHDVFDSDAAFCPNDGSALEPPGGPLSDRDPYIDTVIHGDIRIKSVAGAGAMGRVYRAHQRGIDRDVAVKILHRELSGNLPLVQRFHREAKIASKLQHPHVVEVYLAGQLPDGALYIAMEYLDGMSLATAAAAAGGTMPLERALPIALQICDAVGEGHSRGIVHRDLKPENVMLVHRADTSDWVKVLDFGIAKVSLGEQSMETAAGLIFGTARYISPEGAQGATVGPPGDVYSIAVMLYQLLAGKTPFDAEQPVGLLIKHIHEPPPTLRSWPAAADVPEPIARVIMENLANEPSQRAPNARALGNAIAGAAKEANVSFSDVGVVARMSMLDAAPRRVVVEPTLDDAAAQAPPALATPARPVAPPMTPRRAAALADTTANEPTPQEITGRPAPAGVAHAPPKRSAFVIVLAFLLGVAITALALQYVSTQRDEERLAHVARARNALAKSQYVEPPGETSVNLVQIGLAKWPHDSSLSKLQADAAHELVTRAMAARSGGDVAGARDLARTAHELDPTDGTASLLLAQYEGELAAAGDAGGELSGARVTLDVPLGRARPGARAELVGHVIVGSSRQEVVEPRFVVKGPGLASEGLVIAAIGAGPYRGFFAPPREGDYEVRFEASVAGASVRAIRTLNVTR
ncbi:MAG: serine/threonine protein kinase [Labilithrix sp.]|nr:serine/threonine protein kinase [Labilithrix sp.]